MKRLVLTFAILIGLAAPATAEGVYYCADTKAAGISWDEKKPTGEGRVTTFNENRYTMRIKSETKREVTKTKGSPLGTKEFLTCQKPYPNVAPGLLVCRDKSGLEIWAFNGNQYTRAYLFGSPLGTDLADPNIVVAHGVCTKF